MNKKDYRANWEQVFINYNDAELYAISVWIHQMKAKNKWNEWVGKVWDYYLSQQAKQEEEQAEQHQPQEGQSVH